MEIFVITAPGLEAVATAELAALGIDGRPVQGGVELTGDDWVLYRTSLHVRTASRVVVRVGRFRARSFIELERHLKRIDWSPYLAPGEHASLRVSSAKSKLYHEGAIAERVGRRLVEVGLGLVEVASRDDGDDRPEADHDRAGNEQPPNLDSGSGQARSGAAAGESQLVIVRFHRDECLVSVDASGALLHRRGYRRAVAKAPLRETLAAGMLLGSGWRPGMPLVDPFCGSGTLLIEAALIANRIPPGLADAERLPRPYAMERWPSFDSGTWADIVDEARGQILTSVGSPLRGSDRDHGAIEAARANALRAGVAADIAFDVAAFSSLDCREANGWIVTNPPYGLRVGERGPLRNLYASIGSVLRGRCTDWSIAMLSADPELARQTGIEWGEALRTTNGGIPVRLLTMDAGAGTSAPIEISG